MPSPAYHLQTPRLDLWAADPARAVAFLECARASRPELLPWMDWAAELPDEQGIVSLMRTWRGWFDLGRDRHYHVVERDTDQVIGAVGTHPRVRGKARELGYWIRSDRHGRGYATEAVAAVIRAELDLMRLDRVDIYVEPDNTGSLRVVDKLGLTRQGLLPGHITFRGEPARDAIVSCLTARAWPGHPLRSRPVRAWDVLGKKLELELEPG